MTILPGTALRSLLHARSGAAGDTSCILPLPALLAVPGGAAALAELRHALALPASAPPPPLLLRRTQAAGQVVPFHCDTALATVQVALEEEGGCVGGRLVYAGLDGALVEAPRVPGAALAHTRGAVHGVTQLTSGTRYSLFALVLPEE